MNYFDNAREQVRNAFPSVYTKEDVIKVLDELEHNMETRSIVFDKIEDNNKVHITARFDYEEVYHNIEETIDNYEE